VALLYGDSVKIILSVASPDDAEALLAIYAPYVRETAISYEYNVPTVEEFRQRIEKILENYPYLIAKVDGEIVGYAYASRFELRRAYDWDAETSIYIRQDMRVKGIGRALYTALEEALKIQNYVNLVACIAYTEQESKYLTHDSTHFHEKMGYRLFGHFKNCGYKFDRWFDMTWLEKRIADIYDTPQDLIPFPEIRSEFEKKILNLGETT